MQQTQYIALVKNAFRILRCFSLEEPEKRVSDIANMLGINKSTVSRTLATMANEGFVYKDPDTNKYRLGLSIVSLSGIVSSQLDVYRESQPVLNSLVDSIGETAHLAILDETDIMYLQKVECHQPSAMRKAYFQIRMLFHDRPATRKVNKVKAAPVK